MPILILPQFPIIVSPSIFFLGVRGQGLEPDFGWRVREAFALLMCAGEEMKANHGGHGRKNKAVG